MSYGAKWKQLVWEGDKSSLKICLWGFFVVFAAAFINCSLRSPLNVWFGNDVDDYVPSIIMFLLVIYPHKHAPHFVVSFSRGLSIV